MAINVPLKSTKKRQRKTNKKQKLTTETKRQTPRTMVSLWGLLYGLHQCIMIGVDIIISVCGCDCFLFFVCRVVWFIVLLIYFCIYLFVYSLWYSFVAMFTRARLRTHNL